MTSSSPSSATAGEPHLCLLLALRALAYYDLTPPHRFHHRSTLYGFTPVERRRRLERPLPRHALDRAAQAAALRQQEQLARRQQQERERQTESAPVPRQPAGPSSVAPVTSSPTAAITPERALQIQAGLSAFHQQVVSRQGGSDAPVPRVLRWVSGHMAARGAAPPTMGELETVLGALAAQDAVMLTDDEASGTATVWFV
jgi:hypothetical protein